MSTSDKLTYLNGTKQALKESINNLGGDITSETTFRNYAEELDNIYDNLPKTTGEDTNLSLTTLKGKMNIQVKGDTSQNGTPTPDTPIDIEVVTGEQEVKVGNKNLVDFSTPTSTGNKTTTSIISDTLVVSNTPGTYQRANWNILDVVKNNAGKTLKLTFDSADTSGVIATSDTATVVTIMTKTTTTSYNTLLRKNLQTATYTIPSDISDITEAELQIYTNNTSTSSAGSVTIVKPMLIFNESSTTYTPHQEQTQTISLGDIELCKIGTYQDYLYKSNDKWYKKGYIEKIANKTNWLVNSIGTNNRAITVLASNGYGNAVNGFNTTNAVCNMLIAESQGTIASDTNINRIAVNNENIYIKFADTINTKALAEAQLDSMASLVIYYVLATATDTEITDTSLINQLNNLEKLMSYNGTTNISSSGNLPIVLGVSALKGE